MQMHLKKNYENTKYMFELSTYKRDLNFLRII